MYGPLYPCVGLNASPDTVGTTVKATFGAKLVPASRDRRLTRMRFWTFARKAQKLRDEALHEASVRPAWSKSAEPDKASSEDVIDEATQAGS